MRLTPIINVGGKILFYFALAAFFLILSDLIEFMVEGFQIKREMTSDKLLSKIHSFFLACSALSIIVLPNLSINMPVKEVNAWSDTVTLAGLGISIILIGLKTERVQERILAKKITEMANETVNKSN